MFERTNEAVRKRYNGFAPLYDIDDIFFLGSKQDMREKAIKLARIKRGKKVLDVMAGTGDTTLLASGKGAEVVAVDFSESMIKVAKRKVRKGGFKNVSFIISDASDLPRKNLAWTLEHKIKLRRYKITSEGLLDELEISSFAGSDTKSRVNEFIQGKEDNINQ